MLPTDLDLLFSCGTSSLLPDARAAVVAVSAPDLHVDRDQGRLWWVPLDGRGQPRPLTHAHEDSAPVCSPDGRSVAFCRSIDGGPAQLYVLPLEGGEPVQITRSAASVSAPRFSPDGRALAYLARDPQDGRYTAGGDPDAEPPRLVTSPAYRHDNLGYYLDRPRRVWVVDLPVGDEIAEPRPVSGPELEVLAFEWWPDSHRLVAVAGAHPGHQDDLRQDALLLDRTGAMPVPLTDAGRGSQLGVDRALPTVDGTAVWLLATDLGPDGLDFVGQLAGAYRLAIEATADGPRAQGAPVRVTDPDHVEVVPDSAVVDGLDLLVGVERHGSVQAVRLAGDGSSTDLSGPGTVVHGLAVANGAVLASVGTADSAGALQLLGAEVRTVADWSAPLRATGRLVRPTALTATAPDGAQVRGWVARPDAERHGPGPYPTILMIHGGPYAQYTHALFDEVQVLAGAGYAVVYGNPRGSAGAGRDHARAIERRMGTVDTDDVLALLDEALTAPDLDESRVGVMGGSYGGYLTAWLTTRTDRFAAAIVERGFLDPVSFVGSSDIGWFFGLRYVGDHASDPELVAAQSPMAHVGRVRTPTLVIHSEHDWRCPVEQGQRWFVELHRRGVDVRLLLFPGEGHELSRSGRPTHRRARFEHVLAWWSEHLPVAQPMARTGD